jgi:XRE family aerobic/anaerobic benzoate catabolism transcriptional regulator
VRARRNERRLTLRQLAERAHVSERFLAQLETGSGNISVARLQDVAEALETSAAQLLAHATLAESPSPAKRPASRVVALLGLRGAGKSSIGARVAKRLRVPFVELDALVAEHAGMSLSTIFEMHGEAYFRRLERDVLRKLLTSPKAAKGAVVATGGSIVNDPDTYELLRQRAITVWLKARARDHWDRVVAQGDVRPMRGRANAMSELKALLRARNPLYAQAAHVIDTSSMSLDDAVDRVVASIDDAPRGATR